MVIEIKGGGDPLGRDAPTASKKPKKKPKGRKVIAAAIKKLSALPSNQDKKPNTLEKADTKSLLLRLPADLVDRLDKERFRREATTRTDLIRVLLEEALKP